MLDLGEALFTLLPRQGITGCKHKAYEQHVLLENRRKIEGFWTLAASIRLLPTMYQHVHLEH